MKKSRPPSPLSSSCVRICAKTNSSRPSGSNRRLATVSLADLNRTDSSRSQASATAQTLSRGSHLFVDDLVTLDTEREKGHARALLRWLAAEAMSRGLRRLFLDSRESAIGFYKQLGFEFLKAVPCWIDADRFAT